MLLILHQFSLIRILLYYEHEQDKLETSSLPYHLLFSLPCYQHLYQNLPNHQRSSSLLDLYMVGILYHLIFHQELHLLVHILL